MKLTKENYFSLEADKVYMSNSQYKSFLDCEAKQMAILNGIWEKPEPSIAMKVGSYVHAWNENNLDVFKDNNKDIFKRDGDLKAEFKVADNVINVISKDNLFMTALSGEKEVLITAEMFGSTWKILIDSFFKEKRRFGDLKVLKSFYDKFWNPETNAYDNVFEHRGYFTQMAIYAEVIRLHLKEDDYYEPFLAVVTKEEFPDKEIISFVSEFESVNDFVFRELSIVEKNMKRILLVKSGKEKPAHCKRCDYCKSVKKLSGTRHYTEFNLY